MLYDIIETEIFTAWRENIKDNLVKKKITSRIARAQIGNFGDWKTENGEVKAMRIDYGPGYRLYYIIRGKRIVFLLCGGDKRSQAVDIKKAIDLAREV